MAGTGPGLPCPRNPLPPVSLHFPKVLLSFKTVFAAEDKVFNHKSVGKHFTFKQDLQMLKDEKVLLLTDIFYVELVWVEKKLCKDTETSRRQE